jgi:CHAT domain-containing protein
LTTPSQPSAHDDGFLSLYEVYDLNLPRCELAVLSACETNCGPESPLEAGSTMARAFICAGSRRVVCSHWSVSDQATSQLVGRFMQTVAKDLHERKPVDYAGALQAAKKSLRGNPRTASPYFWAPFVLIGPPGGRDATAAEQSFITAQSN